MSINVTDHDFGIYGASTTCKRCGATMMDINHGRRLSCQLQVTQGGLVRGVVTKVNEVSLAAYPEQPLSGDTVSLTPEGHAWEMPPDAAKDRPIIIGIDYASEPEITMTEEQIAAGAIAQGCSPDFEPGRRVAERLYRAMALAAPAINTMTDCTFDSTGTVLFRDLQNEVARLTRERDEALQQITSLEGELQRLHDILGRAGVSFVDPAEQPGPKPLPANALREKPQDIGLRVP